MRTETTLSDNHAKELEAFKAELKTSGVHGALRYLNNRTPHRYTGIYRYEGETLQNLVLFDRFDPSLQKSEDTPLGATYCSLLQKQKKLEITDATEDANLKKLIITPVVSYCGVLITDGDGKPFGSLCHFDMRRCQQRSSDIPLLESAADILYQYLQNKD